MWDAAVRIHGQEPAIATPDRVVTYAELDEAATLLERALDAIDPDVGPMWVDTSDRVATAAAVVASWMTGRTWGPVAPGETPPTAGLLVVGGDIAAIDGPSLDDNGLALCIFSTSGTTGAARHVAHTPVTLAAGLAAALAVQAPLLGLDPPEVLDAATVGAFRTGTRIATTLDPATIAGYTILQRALTVGDTWVPLPGGLAPAGLLDAITNLDVTTLALPALEGALLARHLDTSPGRTLPALASIGLGGAQVHPSSARSLEMHFGCPVSAGYGATELGGAALMARFDDPPEERWGTVGTPLPGIEARIHGDGRLHIASPARAIGVIDGDGTLRRWTPGWYDTGDLASIGDGGTVRIDGRADTLIVRGGRRIDPTPYVSRLLDHPAIDAAVVYGVPSRVPGETDVAAAVAGSITEADARRWVAGHGPARVRRIHVLDALPVARDGNVSLAELRALPV